MSEANQSSKSDSLDRDIWIDALCDRFESALQAGQKLTIHDFLKAEGIDPANAHPKLLLELRKLEDHYHSQEDTSDQRTSEHVQVVTLVNNPSIPSRIGQVIAGRYELIRELGTGGMGTVYLAKQTKPVHQEVALKLIRTGIDSRSVFLRFEAERQAIAMMNHTNIARFYDAGTTKEQQPYFVMEAVNGPPITEYCDRNRCTPKERLELFIEVCKAIQHAHLKGIIHRDIKPSNVLIAIVDGKPIPKVIDFGVAKAIDHRLTEIILETGFGALVGTAEYMSPEQADIKVQQDIDIRSDIYSLGVLLYELLTGTTPVDRKSFVKLALLEILRIVREVDAPRPSDKLSSTDALPSIAANRNLDPAKLVKQCRGELDWILLKSLEKDRNRRYASAEKFGEDVQHYLDDEVVEAQPPSRKYKVKKFLRKNRRPVFAAGSVLMALILGIIGTTLGLLEAREARAAEAKRADREQQAKDDADKARLETTRQLWRSQLGEALAQTRSGLAGHRFGSLNLLRTALTTAQETGLSDLDRKKFQEVAVAAIAQPDLEVVKEWEGYPVGSEHLAIDARFERYARTHIDGSVSVRRVSDDEELYSFPPTGSPRMVTLSDSGKVLVVSDSDGAVERRLGRVYLLEGEKPKLLQELPVVMGRNVFVSPDDQRVISGTTNSINVWYRSTDQRKSWPLPGPQHGVAGLTRDGRRLAIGCQKGNAWVLHVRDLETGQVVAELPLSNSVDACTWHPEGRIVAVGSNRKIHIWDVDTKRELRILEGHKNGGVVPNFDATGERIISNDWNGILRVWDWRASRQILRMTWAYREHERFMSDDGRVFARTTDGKRLAILQFAPGLERQPFAPAHVPVLWMQSDPAGRFAVVTKNKPGEYDFGEPAITDLYRGDEIGRLPIRRSGQRCFHVASDGSLITNGTSGIVRWPLTTNSKAGVLRFGPPEQVTSYYSSDVHSASADGRVIAVPRYSSGAITLRPDRPNEAVTLGPQHDVRNTAVSPDGRFVVTGTHSATTAVGIKVWDAQTGASVAELKDQYGTGIFSPDGRWMAKWGGSFRLWRTDTWTEGPSIPSPETVLSCLFSPDSRVLAVSGHSTVRLIRVEDGTELASLPYSEQSIIVLKCFSPEGGTLYAAGVDTGELVAWDLRRLRAGLSELGLDWDEPPLAPITPPAQEWQVEFVGAELLGISVSNQDLMKLNDKLTLQKTKLGTDHPDTLLSMHNLGAAYRQAGKRDLALPLLQDTLKLRRAKLGTEHADTIATMNTLAMLYRDVGNMGLALPLIEETLKLRKAKFGNDHVDTLASMNTLGWAYWSSKQFDKSIPLFEESLKLREAKLGRTHPDTLLTVANLGVNYKEAGRFKEAAPLLDEAFKAYKASKTQSSVQWVLTQLLSVLVELGRWDEVVARCRESQRLDDAIVRGCLALGLLMTGKDAEAERIIGMDHNGYQRVLMFAYAGRTSKAEAELKVLLARDRNAGAIETAHFNRVGWIIPSTAWDPIEGVRIGSFGVEAVDSNWTHYGFGCALFRAGQLAKAEAELQLSISRDPNWAPGTLALVRAMIAKQEGRIADAEKLYKEGCRLPEQVSKGPYHFCEYHLVRREADRVFAAGYDPKADIVRQIESLKPQIIKAKAHLFALPLPKTPSVPARYVRGNGWNVDGTELVCSTKDTACIVGFGDPMWMDYDFSLDMRFDGAGENVTDGRLCIGTRVLENATLQTFTMAAEKNSVFLAQHWTPQGVTLARQNGKLTQGQWYSIKVEVRGKRFQYFLDGKKVFNFENDANPRGFLQIDAIRAAARFRNIRVTDPKGQILWQGPPSLGPDSVRLASLELESMQRSLAFLEARHADKSIQPGPVTMADFRELHGADLAELRRWLCELPRNFRPISLTARAGANPVQFDVLAVDDGQAVPWLVHLALDPSVANACDVDSVGMMGTGWILATVCHYTDDKGYRRHHIWVKGGATTAYWPKDRPEMLATLEQLRKANQRPVWMHGLSRPAWDILSGPAAGRKWEVHTELTPEQLTVKIDDARRRKWRPSGVFVMPGKPGAFAVVLIENPTDERWEFHGRLNVQAYELKLSELRTKGFRPISVLSEAGTMAKYTAVWLGDLTVPVQRKVE
jgi:serine/threonine protein kinase/WD40 repeat protein/tetratricopeptide (TPR) repeat protein